VLSVPDSVLDGAERDPGRCCRTGGIRRDVPQLRAQNLLGSALNAIAPSAVAEIDLSVSSNIALSSLICATVTCDAGSNAGRLRGRDRCRAEHDIATTRCRARLGCRLNTCNELGR
jgi:hypothetical protein